MKNQQIIFFISFLIFTFTTFCHSQSEIWYQTGEHLVCPASYDTRHYWKEEINWPIIDKNWNSVACKVKRGAKWAVMINGAIGSYYTEIKHMLFSPHGDTLIYVGTKGATQLLRMSVSTRKYIEKDDRTLYDTISPPIFGLDAGSWAYGSRLDQFWDLIINGAPTSLSFNFDNLRFGPKGNLAVELEYSGAHYFMDASGVSFPFNRISDITFNPFTGEAAYWGDAGNKIYLFEGGTQLNSCDKFSSIPSPILYSPNGVITYSYGINPNQFYVVHSGIVSPAYDRIKWLKTKFNPDGNSIVFPAGKGNNEFIVFKKEDDAYYKEEQHFEAVDYPIFSPDGFSIMYFAYESNKWFTVVNKQREKRYDMVKENVFNPNSIDYAYAAMENDKWFVVQNGLPSPDKFDDVSNLMFNSNGNKFVYIVKVDSFYRVILNQVSDKEYPNINSLQFTPDGNFLGYIVMDKSINMKFVVINGTEGKKYRDIKQLEVSPDGKKFGYFALEENGNIVWVVD